MRGVQITRHARKRVERGDRLGLRTKMTVSEVIELLSNPATLRVGQRHFVYSEKDDGTYQVITARQGRTLVTVYDTRREPRIIDMVTRARANAPFEFSEPPPVESYAEDNASMLTLGTYKYNRRKEHIDFTDLCEIGSIFGLFKHNEDILESRFLHELVVEATMIAVNEGGLSRTQIKKLHLIIDDRVNRYIGFYPVWIAFTLLGLEYEGGVFIPRQ